MTRPEYLLTLLSEECVETSQRASKAIRFGLDEIYPEQDLTNGQRITYEFNDIVAVMEILKSEGFLDIVIDRKAIELKKNKIEKYFNYSKEECGTVDHDKLTMGFFSREDPNSINALENIFAGKEGYVWFIELRGTIQWLTKINTLTRIPHEAMQFKSRMDALSYCVKNKLGAEYTQTEHEFNDKI